ncbi:MAG TPA: hypothetical protein PLB88_06040 [Thermoanaerobaculaceae bacterium]|nr:hypothetical protein [Thermoanaerobaculaceae bacterium]
MTTRGSSPDATALLFSFVETLQGMLETDETLRAACTAMERLGLAPLVRVELVAGAERPKVVCADRRATVPQWSEQDAEVLRSVGIASDRTDPDPGPPQPRRREPR